MGGLFNWLAKVLANRIKRVLEKVISKAQNAFIECSTFGCSACAQWGC